MNLLLDKPVRVKDRGVSILIPRPVNFCLQKILIAGRRKNPAKKEKDLRHAVLVGAKVKPGELRKVYSSLPKPWQEDIINGLLKASKVLPVLDGEIKALRLTLQGK